MPADITQVADISKEYDIVGAINALRSSQEILAVQISGQIRAELTRSA